VKKAKFFPLWVYPTLIVMAIGTVWLRLSIVRTTYEINQADRIYRNLQQEREQEQLKVTALRSPRRLETIAKTKFGLSQPRADQVIHLRQVAGHVASPSVTSLQQRRYGAKSAR
jgi:cell division protein FtsL